MSIFHHIMVFVFVWHRWQGNRPWTWCWAQSYLQLNITESKEVIVDLRRNSSTPDATNNKGQTVDYMQSFVFWGYYWFKTEFWYKLWSREKRLINICSVYGNCTPDTLIRPLRHYPFIFYIFSWVRSIPLRHSAVTHLWRIGTNWSKLKLVREADR